MLPDRDDGGDVTDVEALHVSQASHRSVDQLEIAQHKEQIVGDAVNRYRVKDLRQKVVRVLETLC